MKHDLFPLKEIGNFEGPSFLINYFINSKGISFNFNVN